MKHQNIEAIIRSYSKGAISLEAVHAAHGAGIRHGRLAAAGRSVQRGGSERL